MYITTVSRNVYIEKQNAKLRNNLTTVLNQKSGPF